MFRFWRRQSVGFLFVYEIYGNGFAPNSHGIRVWSLARSLNVKVKGQGHHRQKRHFRPFRRPACGLCLVKHLYSYHYYYSCVMCVAKCSGIRYCHFGHAANGHVSAGAIVWGQIWHIQRIECQKTPPQDIRPLYKTPFPCSLQHKIDLEQHSSDLIHYTCSCML